ncbi:MAG: DUF1538 domain-containing protein [Candidatus Cloacimonetes bacterium]|nr:DUF1538 domain-containing protein [Candidatus Cloacimonadota bacterium]MDD2719594.1 DUF1538 domain-containing protein [Candidatus Cloacimonadota bacterium]MDD3097939.1 DUF1538 domain-containing protein [Candidatus Cloacimonadota bacterium]MDD3578167.1 DUF1538 domain-containing protein [Candidatus Cloacimonadota bacterium]MDD4791302.1 DUF1538 domain-containing protein [Candidatus Cloacimonadota bacterium]
MKRAPAAGRQYRVSGKEALSLILRYVQRRISEQIKAVAGIIIYLLLFQSIVLGIPILDAAVISLGMVLVVVGLAFFLEGLLIGIMPMGEEIGIRLPQKASTTVILIIAFVLGLGATLAEPAIGVLKVAGSSVLAWQAPLLFLLLNRFSAYLVAAVGLGVGIALVLSMFRFLKGHSLKPYIYVLISLLLALSLYAQMHPNLRHLLGLAWDCGGVTTGPVTVPLVLALGIGISHVANRGGEKTEGGFGVVTLASLVPVIAVICLGIVLSFRVPPPSLEQDFFRQDQHSFLFESDEEMKDYVISKANISTQLQVFQLDEAALISHVESLMQDPARFHKVFNTEHAFEDWLNSIDSPERKAQLAQLVSGIPANTNPSGGGIKQNVMNALRAIVPLSIFLLFVLYFILRERLTKPDEVFMGLIFAIVGMAVFSGGIELGLSKVGDQVGSNLPVSFTQMDYPEQRKMIQNFDDDLVNTAITAEGESRRFFYYEESGDVTQVEFKTENYDAPKEVYRHIPSRGPLFGKGPYSIVGILVVLLFAYIMGYSATLAEPALNALGLSVEDITVGAFKKGLLIQSVGIGVGAGIALGVAKIIWNLPLFWILGPIYLLLLIFTGLSSEEFVNIGWDSAGVTTGPITVPLVLSMGLGIGSQVGVVEGFGILSLASACPIITVLGMGLYINGKRKAFLRDYQAGKSELSAEDMVL